MARRVVVVGAGVYGAAVAAELAVRGVGTTVVEAGAPAGGTSGATFSWTNSCGKKPRSYHDLSVAGMAAHRRLAADVPHSDWYHEGGNLEWAADEPGRAALRRKVAEVLDFGYEARWLDRVEVLRLEPDLNPDRLPDDEIAYFPREGWIEPTRLVGYLLSTAISRGAELVRDDAAAGFGVEGDAITTVLLTSGRRVPVDAVVNCAGPSAARVAELAGLKLAMRNTLGALVYTSPVAVAVSRVIHAPDIHLRPDGAGRLLLHTRSLDAAARDLDTGPGHTHARRDLDEDTLAAVLAAGRALYPALKSATVESTRVGERPIPGDGLPVLGRARALPNFHFAVSHSGATLSLHAATLVADELLGQDHTATLAPFRFERF
ncbi:FAD-binding oxidoreductase [Actinokineospora auranticolor]|uniref:Glycine/D-amino acid oxidase-like deaminating enzyme n=1 Tax=Actinokineospora auranticolor TaxID=155976 RepID=A0A2S6GQF1_9PSEU|nr:FAD-binding oxidoreductase [Actinokineospora auranticolor]PPK67341.1 glycine/D-amino acid oxidase-like deaminating enzyme [Actinokineospora auranticolor]